MGRRPVVLFVFLLAIFVLLSGCSLPPEGSPDWHFNRAYDLAGQGFYEAAVEEYTMALETNPTRSIKIQTYINRAAAYASLKCWAEAIADASCAINLDSERTMAYLNRGIAYNGKGIYYLAIADFTTAIELNDAVAEAYVHRAYAYCKTENYNGAITDCNTALDIDPEQTYAYFNRGLAHKELGLTQEAISDFEAFIAAADSPTWIERATRYLNSLRANESETESAGQ